MNDAKQRNGRTILLVSGIAYFLSLCPWLFFALALFIGPAQMTTLLALSWLATLAYPLVVAICLFLAWRAYRRNDFRPILKLALAPLAFIPLLFLLGMAALWQAA
jgi:hypothetical protein